MNVGFDIRMDAGTLSTATIDASYDIDLTLEYPIAIRQIMNGCNCPATTFVGDGQPEAMEVYAVSSPKQTKALAYQNNYIELVYGQNCGSYTLRVEPTDPACDLAVAITFETDIAQGGPNLLSY